MIGSRHLAPFVVSNGTCAVGRRCDGCDPIHLVIDEIVFIQRRRIVTGVDVAVVKFRHPVCAVEHAGRAQGWLGSRKILEPIHICHLTKRVVGDVRLLRSDSVILASATRLVRLLNLRDATQGVERVRVLEIPGGDGEVVDHFFEFRR